MILYIIPFVSIIFEQTCSNTTTEIWPDKEEHACAHAEYRIEKLANLNVPEVCMLLWLDANNVYILFVFSFFCIAIVCVRFELL